MSVIDFRSAAREDAAPLPANIEAEQALLGCVLYDNEAFYAHFLEGGTDIAPAYPFLLPAFEEHQHEVASDIQDVLRTL